MGDTMSDKEQAWGEQTKQLLQKAQMGCRVHSLCVNDKQVRSTDVTLLNSNFQQKGHRMIQDLK